MALIGYHILSRSKTHLMHRLNMRVKNNFLILTYHKVVIMRQEKSISFARS